MGYAAKLGGSSSGGDLIYYQTVISAPWQFHIYLYKAKSKVFDHYYGRNIPDVSGYFYSCTVAGDPSVVRIYFSKNARSVNNGASFTNYSANQLFQYTIPSYNSWYSWVFEF